MNRPNEFRTFIIAEMVVPRDRVIEELHRADVTGKHGRVVHDWEERVPQEKIILIRVDPHLIDVEANEDRAKLYASIESEFPPAYLTYGTFSARRRTQKLFAQNGNHRVRAAQLRDDPFIRAFIPEPDLRRFINVMTMVRR